MDLKQLLKKYIDHVGAAEGVDFIPRDIGKPRNSFVNTPQDNEGFSDEELEVLWDCANWDEANGCRKERGK